jgi:hypothetical protein
MLTALLLHVSLAFPSTPALPFDTIRTAVAEAAVLWSPYGVAIDVAAPFDSAQDTPCGWATDDCTVLTVVVRTSRTLSSRAAAGWRGALGAITFEPNGTPSPVITVFLTDIERFIADTRVLGAPEWQWPRVLRDRVVGRVLGRVIAHEIGHFVLRTPRHAAVGLMRPVQSPNDMVEPSRHGFVLSPGEVERLREARQ